MLLRGWTFLVWALVAASAALWGLRLFVSGPALPPQTLVAAADAAAHADLARLFGSDPVPAAAPELPADSRFQLLGVVSPRSPRASDEGLALIVVDGNPARAYRVGAKIDDGNVLQAVDRRGATLGPRDGPAKVALSLPPPEPAATGMLPPANVPRTMPAPPPVQMPNRGRPSGPRAPPIASPGGAPMVEQPQPLQAGQQVQ